MRQYKLELVSRVSRTPSIESFRFSSETKLDFIAGQFLRLLFDKDNPKNSQLNKYLSFSSSPFREYIEVTKRITQSEFSQKLKTLKIKDTVFVEPPLGSCIFKTEYSKVAFITGGIGITPVISILEDIMQKQINADIILFYSNKTEDEIAFKNELDAWSRSSPGFRVFYFVSDCQPKDSKCIWGRIDKEFIVAKAADIKDRKVFIFGPPKMVEAMKAIAEEAGAAQEAIISEGFAGY